MTAELNLKMQNDRRSGHLLQGFVKWLAGQRPSFSSACRLFCHSLLRLPLSRRTWPARQAAPTAALRDSCDLHVNLVAEVAGLDLQSRRRHLRHHRSAIFGGGREACQPCHLFALQGLERNSTSIASDFADLSSLHIFVLSFLSGASLPLRWLKTNPTAWVLQQKSLTIFWRGIANEIKPFNVEAERPAGRKLHDSRLPERKDNAND